MNEKVNGQAADPIPTYYEVREVDEETFDALNVGEAYAGGVIVEGLAPENKAHLLVTRHQGEKPSWDTKFFRAMDIMRSMTVVKLIPNSDFTSFLGDGNKIKARARRELAARMAIELMQAGAIQFLERKSPEGVEITGHIVTVLDRAEMILLLVELQDACEAMDENVKVDLATKSVAGNG